MTLLELKSTPLDTFNPFDFLMESQSPLHVMVERTYKVMKAFKALLHKLPKSFLDSYTFTIHEYDVDDIRRELCIKLIHKESQLTVYKYIPDTIYRTRPCTLLQVDHNQQEHILVQHIVRGIFQDDLIKYLKEHYN